MVWQKYKQLSEHDGQFSNLKICFSFQTLKTVHNNIKCNTWKISAGGIFEADVVTLFPISE